MGQMKHRRHTLDTQRGRTLADGSQCMFNLDEFTRRRKGREREAVGGTSRGSVVVGQAQHRRATMPVMRGCACVKHG